MFRVQVLKSKMKQTISVDVEENLFEQIKQRAKKNHLSVKEQIKYIIVRSMANYGKPGRSYGDPYTSKFMRIFSRKKPGPKPKK